MKGWGDEYRKTFSAIAAAKRTTRQSKKSWSPAEETALENLEKKVAEELRSSNPRRPILVVKEFEAWLLKAYLETPSRKLSSIFAIMYDSVKGVRKELQ